ncbi:MAG TPA: ABC transporter substrate-binding protein, partial [Polyangiaceae bacterium]|nr:ABC transporter substrate-binding protein [Polyangiaceae bacterium]
VFEAYNDRLEQRMASRTPPSTFQSNQGRRLLQWALYNGQDDSLSRLTPLNAIAERQGWTDGFPPEVLTVNSFRDRLYAIPISIIRQNMLYYNVRVLQEHGIDPDELRTLDDLLAACRTLQQAGVTPLAAGNKYKWVLDMILWEQLFPSLVGAEYYTAFWQGEGNPRDEEVQATLDAFLELVPYFNDDYNELDWDAGLMQLFPADGSEPKAAMAPMGDWGTGFYTALDKEPGQDFGAIPFPGAENVFVFSADVFPLVAGVENQAAAEEFLITVADSTTQTRFNAIKGSLPARTDAVDLSDFTELQRKSFGDFTSRDRVSVVHGFKPNEVMAMLYEAVADMASDGDKELLLHYLEANYASLREIPR